MEFLHFIFPPLRQIPFPSTYLPSPSPLANSRAVSPLPFVSRAEDKTNTENEEERATRTASGITRLYRGTCDRAIQKSIPIGGRRAFKFVEICHKSRPRYIVGQNSRCVASFLWGGRLKSRIQASRGKDTTKEISYNPRFTFA